MAGLTNELFEHLNRDWEARKQVLGSQAHKDQEESFKTTLNFLRKNAKGRDIHTLLDDERVMIRHSLKFDANSPEEAQSLKTAADQLDDAAKCLDVVCNDPKGYMASAQTYPTKKKEAGLPLDAFRDFLKSHTARLTNRLAGKASHSEKLILRQRKENLAIVKECYVELQQKALGMESPQKNKGLSR